MIDKLKYSVIILLEEHNEDLIEYLESLERIFSERTDRYEILILANGTEGLLKSKLALLMGINGMLRGFAFNKKTSQAVCIKAALRECKGSHIVVCGSYMQIEEASFMHLVDELDERVELISPWRQNRVDPWLSQVQSRIFNWLVRIITKAELHDLSCTVKLFKREVIENTDLYGNMFRFLPIVAAQKGYRYREVPCNHFQERGPTGLYSITTYTERVFDILTLYFITGFSRKPLRFFSTVGSVFFTAGGIGFLIVLIQRIILEYPLGDRTMLLTSIIFMVLGIQAVGVGLLGEIIAFTYGRLKPAYSIEKIVPKHSGRECSS
jgi:hypothetical protein